LSEINLDGWIDGLETSVQQETGASYEFADIGKIARRVQNFEFQISDLWSGIAEFRTV